MGTRHATKECSMIRFQNGDEVRVVGLAACEWQGEFGVVVKTIEREGDNESIRQECAVQFPNARRWFLADHLVRAVRDKSVRFFRSEVLERWKDLSPDDVKLLSGKREELVGFLQLRYGLNRQRAEREADEFLAQVRERIALAAGPDGNQSFNGIRGLKASA